MPSNNEIQWKILLQRHDGARGAERAVYPMEATLAVEFAGALLEIECTREAADLAYARREELGLTVRIREGAAEQISIGFTAELADWSEDNYVLAPGAVYGGNRYPAYFSQYPPIRCDSEDFGPDSAEMVSDIPRLAPGGGRLRLHDGDMTTPALGIVFPSEQMGLLLQTGQGPGAYPNGFFLDEKKNGTATVSVTVPGVKETNYQNMTTRYPSADRGADLSAGQSLELRLSVYTFAAPSIQSIFDVLFITRQTTDDYDAILPFGQAFSILENSFNTERWVEEAGYYTMGSRPPYEQAFILGWPGMMMYPLLLRGGDASRRRALRCIDYILETMRSPTGFFYASSGGRECFGDHFNNRSWKDWLLVRRDADALFYLAKCLILIEEDGIDYDAGPLRAALESCADAFVALWRRYGQLGQFVNADTGEIIIGSTTSGALATGALALCSDILDRPHYRDTAVAIGEYYYDQYVSRGVTNGGPGEILQAPDSESAYGMVAGFVTLYEATGDRLWLTRSEEMARQFASWCMSYNYRFPPESEFGRKDMKTVGTVFANAQNKHSAPGICTHAGIELLQLYRYTRDEHYLRLIRQIAGTIPQYLSREDRPILAKSGAPQRPGWMHERVNTSDWEGKDAIGELYSGSCWCIVALLMTCAELPGIYYDRADGTLCVIDHLEARLLEGGENSLRMEICNPTAFDADTTLWVDDEAERPRIGHSPARDYYPLRCPAGKTTVYEIALAPRK